MSTIRYGGNCLYCSYPRQSCKCLKKTDKILELLSVYNCLCADQLCVNCNRLAERLIALEALAEAVRAEVANPLKYFSDAAALQTGLALREKVLLALAELEEVTK